MNTKNDIEQFKAVYMGLGNGRPYQMIHLIRTGLNWSREKFDRVICELAKSGYIDLELADTSEMTFKDIENSYVDDLGYPLFSVCWRS